jgi:hypothetical protein
MFAAALWLVRYAPCSALCVVVERGGQLGAG